MEKDLLSISIRNLKLPVKINNCLTNYGFSIINELLYYDQKEFMKIDQFGIKSFDYLKDILHNLGVKFDWELTDQELQKRNMIRNESKDLLTSIEELKLSADLKSKLKFNRIYGKQKLIRKIIINEVGFLNDWEVVEICNSLDIDYYYLEKERLSLNISNLNLNSINYRFLQRYNINTVSDLLKCQRRFLIKQCSFNDFYIKKLYDKIHSLGLQFNEESLYWNRKYNVIEYIDSENKKSQNNNDRKRELIDRISNLYMERSILLGESDELDKQLEGLIDKAMVLLKKGNIKK